MKLKCLKDTCPETGDLVDMRRCCGANAWSKTCKYYGRKPWSEYMYTTCVHPRSQSQIQELKDRNLMMLDIDKADLLCFNDVKNSQEVAHCCGVLAERLKAFWDDSWRINETEKE